MNFLIVLPTKDEGEYLIRAKACEETWLKDCPIKYEFFSDSRMGLQSGDVRVRQTRMKYFCRYALSAGYDFLYRVDTDAYVWIRNLLSSGFEKFDFFGDERGNGGNGFTLSRKAMRAVIDAEHQPQGQIYWGDMWTYALCVSKGLKVGVGSFFDGQGNEDLKPSDLPEGNWVSAHGVKPEGMKAFYESEHQRPTI